MIQMPSKHIYKHVDDMLGRSGRCGGFVLHAYSLFITLYIYSIYIVYIYIYIQLGLHITSEHQQVSMIDGGHGARGE